MRRPVSPGVELVSDGICNRKTLYANGGGFFAVEWLRGSDLWTAYRRTERGLTAFLGCGLPADAAIARMRREAPATRRA